MVGDPLFTDFAASNPSWNHFDPPVASGVFSGTSYHFGGWTSRSNDAEQKKSRPC